jgi:hypothetical protein
MRRSIPRVAVVLFAVGVLSTLTIHAGLTACAPKAEPPAQAPQAAVAPPQAAANAQAPSAPAPAASDESDDDWRYMGATKAAPVFHPPRGKKSAVQQQQQGK